MKRIPVISMICVSLLIAGCGGVKKAPPTGTTDKESTDKTKKPGAEAPAPAAKTANLTVTAVFGLDATTFAAGSRVQTADGKTVSFSDLADVSGESKVVLNVTGLDKDAFLELKEDPKTGAYGLVDYKLENLDLRKPLALGMDLQQTNIKDDFKLDEGQTFKFPGFRVLLSEKAKVEENQLPKSGDLQTAVTLSKENLALGKVWGPAAAGKDDQWALEDTQAKPIAKLTVKGGVVSVDTEAFKTLTTQDAFVVSALAIGPVKNKAKTPFFVTILVKVPVKITIQK